MTDVSKNWLWRLQDRFKRWVLHEEPRDFLLRRLPRGSVGAEIGVYRGDFSARILQVVYPSMLHLIDPWEYQEEYAEALYGGRAEDGQAEMDRIYDSVLDRFAGARAEGRVSVHRGSSVDVANEIPDRSLDWVYIDGNHEYEYVLEDLRIYHEKVRPGGLLAGDDYGTRGWWEDGVTRAVRHFTDEGACERVLVRRGQFLLRRT